MSVFDQLFGIDEPTTDMERVVDRIARRYGQRKAIDTAFDAVLGDDEKDDLAIESQKLDILMKKKALGLPHDSEDYEDASNEEIPFKAKGLMAAFGVRGSQMIPDPSFLKPKTGDILHGPRPLGPVMEGLKDIIVGGLKNVPRIRRLGRLFG